MGILRAGTVCHVGIIDEGVPLVMPMAYGVMGHELVVHGMAASRLQAILRSGAEICVTVTVLDGIVLARSAFEHSMNYRSVLIIGRPRWIRDRATKLAALRAVSDQMLPGRWEDIRPPDEVELRQTHVCAISLAECSAKIRSGPPEPEEHPWDTWTGVLPLSLVSGPPQPDGDRHPLPPYLASRARTRPAGVETTQTRPEGLDD